MLLLHACCAPCAAGVIEILQYKSPVLLWHNPNIHPFTEYRSRKDCLIDFCESKDLNLVLSENYGLREFISAVCPDFNNRCGHCYHSRLDFAAEYAKKHGYEAFSTTLLISPYQKHDLIKEIGQTIGKKHGLKFYYEDFRGNFRGSQQKSKGMGFYMQKYCGCIFSEEERYLKC